MPTLGRVPHGPQSAPIANAAGGVGRILPRIGKGDREFARGLFGKTLFVDILSLDVQRGTVPVRSGNSFLRRPLRGHTGIKKPLGHLRAKAEGFFDGCEREKGAGDDDQNNRLEVLSEKHLDL